MVDVGKAPNDSLYGPDWRWVKEAIAKLAETDTARSTNLTGLSRNISSAVQAATLANAKVEEQRVVPATVEGVSAVSSADWETTGILRASVQLFWEPAENATAYQIVGGKVNTSGEVLGQVVGSYESDIPDFVLDNVEPGVEFFVAVRGGTEFGVWGDFSQPYIFTVDDTAPPLPAPSLPQLTSDFNAVNVMWDGKSSTGTAMPLYVTTVQPQISFNQTTWVNAGQPLRGAGDAFITDLTQGEAVYVRLVAVSSFGTASAASAAASIVVAGLDLTELETDLANLQDELDDLNATKGKTYYSAVEPAYDPNGLWIDPEDGNKPKVVAARKAYVIANSGGTANVFLAAGGWDVTVGTTALTVAELQAGGYTLFAVDAGYSGITAGTKTALENAYAAGISIYSSGNDTQGALGPMANTAARGAEYKTNPVTPFGTHPIATAWAALGTTPPFNDGDANFVIVPAAGATVVGTAKIAAGADGPMVAVIEKDHGAVKWIHSEAYNPPVAVRSIFSDWLSARWVPVQDAGIAAAAQTASGAASTANTALTAANGKTKIILSTNAATGTNYNEGDIWYRKSGTTINAQWEFTGGAWASRTLTDALFSSISAGKITAGTMSGDRITANTLNGDRIVANTLNGDRIVANTITAGKLAATAIDGMTITGALIQTIATADRGVKFRNAGIEGFDNSGVRTFFLDSLTGQVTAVGATLSGHITATSGSIIGNMSVQGSIYLQGLGQISTSSTTNAKRASLYQDQLYFWADGVADNQSDTIGASGFVDINGRTEIHVGSSLYTGVYYANGTASNGTYSTYISSPKLNGEVFLTQPRLRESAATSLDVSTFELARHFRKTETPHTEPVAALTAETNARPTAFNNGDEAITLDTVTNSAFVRNSYIRSGSLWLPDPSRIFRVRLKSQLPTVSQGHRGAQAQVFGDTDLNNGTYRVDASGTWALEVPEIKPAFAVTREGTAAVNFAHGVWQQVTSWGTPVVNRGFTGWSVGALTIKYTGLYEIMAGAGFATGTGTAGRIIVAVNRNSTNQDTNVLVNGNFNNINMSKAQNFVYLTAGDVLRFFATQQTTETRAMNGEIHTYLSVVYVSP